MRPEFVCGESLIGKDKGKHDITMSPHVGDLVCHDGKEYTITAIVHDLGRRLVQVRCTENEPPKQERTGRRSRFVPLPSTETPDGT